MSIAKSIVSYSFIKCEVSEREIYRSGHLVFFVTSSRRNYKSNDEQRYKEQPCIYLR